jgi:hypothetical protein
MGLQRHRWTTVLSPTDASVVRPHNDEAAKHIQAQCHPSCQGVRMSRRLTALPILLALFVACRDGPAQLTTPAENGLTGTAPAETALALVNLLQDPFVHELMEGVAAPTDLLDGAAEDALRGEAPARILALSNALTVARDWLLEEQPDAESADASIMRAALVLMLDDALMSLEDRPTPAGEIGLLESTITDTRRAEDERQ